ncbi:hypothetical protein O7626_39425 [Micromonospora sp. WMMD1102]|uniref:hypothetical protein n=1 Tax=Micromonospora sp. WMMD1102 TaxID=3016105 RepID=UPI0024155E3F|nr:hypothetical protein [Micromonospora sp. WMMD1102]MDG4791887.1 hypothetical protein [Micromonospora sp. WMMD1102]
MMQTLIDALPILGATVIPALVLLAIGYVLRPQGGDRWLSPRPVPVRELTRRLDREWRAHPEWTALLLGRDGHQAWTVRPVGGSR